MPETTVPILSPDQGPPIKCENESEDEQAVTMCDPKMEFINRAEYLRRNKQARQDPTSHRIIEKRRRDRMNNCLADLSRLIPPDYLKKGRGRVEKTEIIEMATKYIKFLQNKRSCTEQDLLSDQFHRGYQECLSEAFRYLKEKPGCVQFINHLQLHRAKLNKGDVTSKYQIIFTDTNSQASSSNHISHGQQFINMQHMNQVESKSNHKERFKHSSSYPMCNDDKSYNYSTDGEKNHITSVNGGNGSSDDNITERRSSFSQQNKSHQSNNNFTSMDVSNNVEDDEGNTRINIIRNIMYADKEEGGVQDCRSEAVYSPVSYNHLHNNSEGSLRNIRKQDLIQGENVTFSVDMDNHSYKFKNTIKQRFSQSQSIDYSSLSDGVTNIGSTSSNDPSPPRREQNHGGAKFNHKRKKANEHHKRHNGSDSFDQSSSGTNSSENSKHNLSMYKHSKVADSKDSLLEDSIKSDSIPMNKLNNKTNGGNKKCEDSYFNPTGVPIFALHAKGSFYVPMNVDYESLIPFLGPYDLLDVTSHQTGISLHPVTINVNFQPTFIHSKANIQNSRTRTDKKMW